MRIRTRAGVVAASLTLMVGAIAVGGGAGFGSAPAYADGATMKITPASQNVASSASSFEVDVMVEGATDVGAFDFTISYDENILELQTIEEGDFLAKTGKTPNCYQGAASIYPPGLANYGCGVIVSDGSLDGADGSGLLATLTFKPKATGTSPLVYINPSGFAGMQGAAINTDAKDGIVKIVKPGDEDGELAATPTVNPSARTPTNRPPSERDPLVRDGSSAATPVPGAATSGGTSGRDTPRSGTLSGQQSGAIRGQGATSSGSAASGPGGAPVAGTGYRAEERSPWWPALYAVLALGAGALIGGVTLKTQRTK